MIRCPQCKTAMTAVRARANPGTLIELDQCGRCGGIWCDKWELFPVDPAEASRIDVLDKKLLSTFAAPAKQTLYCPRCTAKLQACKDPLLPDDVQFRRCQRCDGIWLNRGQFTRYKAYQRNTRKKKMGDMAIIKKIPEVYQNPGSWVVTGTKGIFAYPHAAPEEPEPLKTTLSGAVRLILQTLVRAVLGI